MASDRPPQQCRPTGLGAANSSFIVGDTTSNPRDADGSKKSIYLLSSMPVKEHPMLSTFNIRSYNDNYFKKAIGHPCIKTRISCTIIHVIDPAAIQNGATAS